MPEWLKIIFAVPVIIVFMLARGLGRFLGAVFQNTYNKLVAIGGTIVVAIIAYLISISIR